MEFFRYSRNVYGQQILEGINFDLLWVFAGASAVIIAAHLLVSFLQALKTKAPKALD